MWLIKYLFVLTLIGLTLANDKPPTPGQAGARKRSPQDRQQRTQMKKQQVDPLLQAQLEYDANHTKIASMLQADMVFSKTQFSQNEVQNITAPEVYQEGNLQKVDPQVGAFNLIDFVVEKKVREDDHALLFQKPFSIHKKGHILQLFNKDLETQLSIISLDHGQEVFTQSLYKLGIKIENDFKMHIFGHSANPSRDVNAAIFTHHDNMLYSLQISIHNKTYQQVEKKGEIKLDEVPQSIMSIKSRGANRVLVVYPNHEVKMLNEKLNNVERIKNNVTLQFNDQGAQIEGLVQQPMNVLAFTKHEINSYKLSQSKAIPKVNNCVSQLVDIDQVVFDDTQPNILLAVSKSQNILQVFQLGTSPQKPMCQTKGLIRFDQAIKKHLGNDIHIDSVHIQANSELIYVTFANTNKFAVIVYEPKNIVFSILSQNADEILANSIHHFLNLQNPKEGYNLMINERNLGVSQKSANGHRTQLFENYFKPEFAGLVEEVNESFEFSDIFNPKFIQSLMIPTAVIAVFIYQFYCKTPKASASPGGNMSNAERQSEISKRFANLQGKVGNDDGDEQIDSSSKMRRRGIRDEDVY